MYFMHFILCMLCYVYMKVYSTALFCQYVIHPYAEDIDIKRTLLFQSSERIFSVTYKKNLTFQSDMKIASIFK